MHVQRERERERKWGDSLISKNNNSHTTIANEMAKEKTKE